MPHHGRGAALLEQPDEENPAQAKTTPSKEHGKCSHKNQEVPPPPPALSPLALQGALHQEPACEH